MALIGVRRTLLTRRRPAVVTPAQALSTLIASLTSCGYLAICDRLYVAFGRADQASAALDYIAGGSITFGTGGTWTAADGFIPDGATAMSTGLAWNANGKFKQNDGHILTTHKVNSQTTGVVGVSGSNNLNHGPRNASDQATHRINPNGTSGGTAPNTDSRGTCISLRNASNFQASYMNDVLLGSSTTASTAPASANAISLGRQNTLFTNKPTLILGVGGGVALDATMRAAVFAAIKTYCNIIEPGSHP